MADLTISPRYIQELTLEVGSELAQERDRKAAQRRRRQLPPRVNQAPEVVAVEVDGGRLRTRETGCGPGVHQPQNKEDKIACLNSLHSVPQEQDPQPEPPPSFLQPRRVQRLVRQMAGQASDSPSASDEPATVSEGDLLSARDPAAEPWAPRRLVRTCVASMVASKLFGPMVAGEAQAREFYRAKRRAFVSDGQAYNWTIQKGYFPTFEPITDFLHVLCYLYTTAYALEGSEAERWSRYVGWLRSCWQGRVGAVIEELQIWQDRVGKPPTGEELPANDPRRAVAEALSYLRNNARRMDYPRYRQEGLPMTSSLVESLVGEFNKRLKGREKFWNRPEGAEAMLQVRAALLSEDERLARHMAARPGCPYRRSKAPDGSTQAPNT